MLATHECGCQPADVRFVRALARAVDRSLALRTKGVFKGQALYVRIVRETVTSLYRGRISTNVFLDLMSTALTGHYEQAWVLGARECGVRPDERTQDEQKRLDQAVYNDLQWLYRFSLFISEAGHQYRMLGPKVPKKYTLVAVLSRATLWSNRYLEVKNMARAMSCANQKFEWVMGPTHEHCTDCIKYTGRVHRGAVWMSVGAIPQSQSLECMGFRCRCRLVRTDKPATPGTPAWPTGRAWGARSPVLATFGGPSVPLVY